MPDPKDIPDGERVRVLADLNKFFPEMSPRARSLDEAWLGVMVTYTEQDFPPSQPYTRTIPGWQCTTCGQQVGTSGLPPRSCPGCAATWDPDAKAAG